MKKLFEHSDSPLLFEVVDELNNELTKCSKYLENHQSIYIALKGKINYNEFISGIIEEGYAVCINNYLFENDRIRLIIVNYDACFKSEISKEEYKAIIIHELGHFLNSPIFEEVPSVLYCLKNKISFDLNKIDEIKKLNSQKNEIYADYYAKSFDYGTHLINTFIKYEKHFGKNVGCCELRIEKINSEEVFIGHIKPLNTNL